MAEGWRMWAISLLTIMLLTLLSAVPIDITDDIKKVDAKADNDAMHGHDENGARGGKFFGHNQFDLGNINVPGSVAGDDVSIGHQVNIDVQGHTHDHEDGVAGDDVQGHTDDPHHHEADAVIECMKGLREMFKSIDSNKNGLMDAKELLGVCHQNNIQITESLAVRILTLPDKTVGFNIAKFCELLKDCQSTNSADSIYYLLQLYDKAVDGGWSNWSEYGQCSKECGGGNQTRTRTCTNPIPQHKGRTCEQQNIGNHTETKDCNLHNCVCNPGPYPLLADCFCKNTNGGGVHCPKRSKCDDGVCQPPVLGAKYPCSFDDTQLDRSSSTPGGSASPYKKHWTKWTDNIVHYFYGNEETKEGDKLFMRNVMNIFQSKTCYQFKLINEVEYKTEPRLGIYIGDDKDCTKNTGYVAKGDYNLVKLHLTTHVTYQDGEDCNNMGLVIHEMMHALGVGHTQRRFDRNEHIIVKLENLNQNYIEQYRICNSSSCEQLSDKIPYDCGSIMHYGSHDCSSDGEQTIVPKVETCNLEKRALLYRIHEAKDVPAKDWELLNIIGSKECPVCTANVINPAACFCKSLTGGETCTAGQRCTDGTCQSECIGIYNFGFEFPGNDIKPCSSNKKSTPEACQEFCKTVPGCVGWEWGYDGYNCCAKSKMDGKNTAQSSRVSGLKNACPPGRAVSKRSVQEIATVRGQIILPTVLDFTFPEDSHVHISCNDNLKLPSTSLGGAEIDVSNKSSLEEIHYELEADLSNSDGISMSAIINVGWKRDPIGDQWIRKGDFINMISLSHNVTEYTSEYQMDIAVVHYN